MANNYLICEKGYNKQLASAYIAYMMAGSLFSKAHCSNKMEEKHLMLHYKGMPVRQQEQMEERVDRVLYRKMDSQILKNLQKESCQVKFSREGELYFVDFRIGGKNVVTAAIDGAGKIRIKIQAEKKSCSIPELACGELPSALPMAS